MLHSLRLEALYRQHALYAVACCHRIWPSLVDARSRTAVETTEAFVEARATPEQWRESHLRALEAFHDLNDTAGFGSPQGQAAWAAYSASAEDMAWALHRDLVDGAGTTFKGAAQADLVRCIFGNPFRTLTVDPVWLTSTAIAIARGMYESRDFSAMPILADSLQDAGCDNEDVVNHCRSEGAHVRGCWVVDAVLGKR
jgi:hypothetical protein